MTDLFTFAAAHPNYRPSDPITSRDAGRSAHKFTAEHHQIILSVLRRAGQPLAPEQIADGIGFGFQRGLYAFVLDTVQVCKRAAELIESGEVERTAERHTNRSGRSAFKLRVSNLNQMGRHVPPQSSFEHAWPVVGLTTDEGP